MGPSVGGHGPLFPAWVDDSPVVCAGGNGCPPFRHEFRGVQYPGEFSYRAVTVNDDDTPGVTLSPSSLTIAEGGSGAYTIVLDTEPSANVTIEITAGGDVTTNPTSVMFTNATWATTQTVTVSAGQDEDGLNDTQMITHAVASSSAAEYRNASLGGVDMTVDDDDVPPKVTITSDAPAPVSATFRVTSTFDRTVTGFEEGDVTGWYSGTPFSFNLTDLRPRARPPSPAPPGWGKP